MTEYYGYNILLEEVDDGFKVHIKGDKEVLRPKLEAIEAWMNYQEKAKAAGWHTGHKFWPGFHGMHGHGHDKVKKFMGGFHKAFREVMDDMKDEKSQPEK